MKNTYYVVDGWGGFNNSGGGVGGSGVGWSGVGGQGSFEDGGAGEKSRSGTEG